MEFQKRTIGRGVRPTLGNLSEVSIDCGHSPGGPSISGAVISKFPLILEPLSGGSASRVLCNDSIRLSHLVNFDGPLIKRIL